MKLKLNSKEKRESVEIELEHVRFKKKIEKREIGNASWHVKHATQGRTTVIARNQGDKNPIRRNRLIK